MASRQPSDHVDGLSNGPPVQTMAPMNPNQGFGASSGGSNLPLSLQIGDYKVWDYLVEVSIPSSSVASLPSVNFELRTVAGDVEGVDGCGFVSTLAGLLAVPGTAILPVALEAVPGAVLHAYRSSHESDLAGESFSGVL